VRLRYTTAILGEQRLPHAQVSGTEAYLVVNAGCREKDLKHINEQLEKYNVSCSACAAQTDRQADKLAAQNCPHMCHTLACVTELH